MKYIIGIILLLVGVGLGGILQANINPRLDEETIGKQYLGEAECMRFKIGMPGPGGTIKIGDQLLCGYHLEWSSIVGGNAEPKEFAPDPDQSDT